MLWKCLSYLQSISRHLRHLQTHLQPSSWARGCDWPRSGLFPPVISLLGGARLWSINGSWRHLLMTLVSRKALITCSNTFKTSKNGCAMKKYIDHVLKKSSQLPIVAEGARIKKGTSFQWKIILIKKQNYIYIYIYESGLYKTASCDIFLSGFYIFSYISEITSTKHMKSVLNGCYTL